MKHRFFNHKLVFVMALTTLFSGASGCSLDGTEMSAGAPDDPATKVETVDEQATKTSVAVKVERVRYCTGSIICNSALSSPQYHFWDDYNVSNGAQKDTMIGRIYEPPKAAVRKLVFTAAGQQFGSGDGTHLTGQTAGFKNGWSKTQDSKWFTLGSSSLPAELLDEGLVSPSDTFMAVAFDHQFNHTRTPGAKDDILDAYYHWLRSKADVFDLDYIVLAGFSRGGCLVTRLAQRFNRDYPEVPLFVSSVDSVCTGVQNEFGTYLTQIDNPMIGDPGWYGWATDITEQFDKPGAMLGIEHMVGGEAAVEIPLLPGSPGAHGFSHYEATDIDFDLGWYHQKWKPYTHYGMGNYSTLASDVVQGLQRHLERLDADCTPVPLGAVAWWGGYITGIDLQGENPMTNTGVTVGDDAQRFGSYLYFDGVDDYAEAPDDDALDFGTGDFSISMWLATDETSGVRVILDKRKTISGVQGYHVFVVDGKLGFQLGDGNGYSNYASSTFIADGQWHAITISVDRDDPAGLVFYVDGTAVSTFNPTGRSGSVSNSDPLRIGSRSTNLGGHAHMVVDEIMLFERALSGADADDFYYTVFADDDGRCYDRDTEVRLRHQSTGSCAYGDPASGGAPKNWPCFNVPYQTYKLRYLGEGEVLLRHQWTLNCIRGNTTNGAAISNVRCDDVAIADTDPDLIYVLDDLGNDTFRLRHKSTGKCIYGNPSAGGVLYNWSCWNDPNLVYALDKAY